MPPFMKYLWILLFPIATLAQDRTAASLAESEETIAWQPARRLSWADFKANPDPTSDAAASTTTLVGIEYNISNNNLGYTINCRFSKDRSWGLHKTPYILAHEQGHFDIAEIFARKLNKAMSEYEFNKKSFQKDLKKIYEDIMKEKEEWQEKYDKETRHSINKQRQAEWLEKIAKTLDEYAAFASYQ
jgi:hypothetical protein